MAHSPLSEDFNYLRGKTELKGRAGGVCEGTWKKGPLPGNPNGFSLRNV